jgi:hypothetical protein
MATITKSYTFSAGATILAAEHNTNFDTLYNAFNGNIDNANIKSGANIALNKLSQSDDVTMSGSWVFNASPRVAANYGLLLSEGTAPTTTAGQGVIYTKDTSGQPELFYREESSGDEVQLTSGGSLNVVATPAGALMMWAGALASPPDGWLICAGAAVSRTTYATLFTAIGTTYGAGDGSTTFNLPNFTNVFPYGANEGASAGNASVGSTSVGSITLSGNDSLVVAKSSNIIDRGDSGGATPRVLYQDTNLMMPYLAVGFIIKT